jgi:ABC-type transporter Mla MlaB component
VATSEGASVSGVPATEAARLVLSGALGTPDAPSLCARLRAALQQGSTQAVECDVTGLHPVDLGTIDALARLTLTARRLGSQVRLQDASTELRDLLALVGLADVVPCCPDQAGKRGGRPKSGNSRAVSRKKVSSAMPPAAGSTTSSAQGS